MKTVYWIVFDHIIKAPRLCGGSFADFLEDSKEWDTEGTFISVAAAKAYLAD